MPCVSVPIGHDLFRHGGGLGTPAFQILKILDADDPLTIEELMGCTGLARPTLSRVLRRMKSVGLAEDHEGAWTCLPNSPDALARAIGTEGRGARQRRRHHDERMKRSRMRAEYRSNANARTARSS